MAVSSSIILSLLRTPPSPHLGPGMASKCLIKLLSAESGRRGSDLEFMTSNSLAVAVSCSSSSSSSNAMVITNAKCLSFYGLASLSASLDLSQPVFEVAASLRLSNYGQVKARKETKETNDKYWFGQPKKTEEFKRKTLNVFSSLLYIITPNFLPPQTGVL